MFLFINASPKLTVIDPFRLVITLKLLATNENCEKQRFLSSFGPLPRFVLLNMRLFSHVGDFRRSHINLKSEIINLRWVNPKYKTDCFKWTERELHWCHFGFAFKCSAQWSVERISYVILLDRLYIEWKRVNKFT